MSDAQRSEERSPHPQARPGLGALTARVRGHGQQVAVGVGVLLVVLGTAGFLGVLDAVQEAEDLAALDDPVLTALAAGRSDVLTVVLTAITTVSGPTVLPIIVLVAALAWGLVRGRWWQAGLLAAAMVVSTLVSVAIKGIVARPRPPVDTMTVAGVESTYSFPSGHTIGAATLLLVAGYLAWVRRPAWASLLGWLALIVLGTGLVGLSRLYLGYHFLTDVTASVALAVAVLGGVVIVDRRRAVRAAQVTAAAPPTAT
ncbi:phosphatase PAP2 family protein [Cellulomonas phragmiteti]|uniref:Phosphatidic acid phosphatase type 2/haloperoxidase domain-containing protein n=1 Tax=Cellulomonas phragmiteti TaxID=478780 RepID=A0ABQ4DPC2_9CELL|nr:phosphatase PAP2 family protein [Cellulomonas phragmiteti]GIG41188.1 hypothetical protein Cph01nite_29500 [Cellulomonas phragmiteti]